MRILAFRAKNHRSLRDETSLELLSSSLKTQKPSAGVSWDEYIGTVASIFGANASGKSNVLDALRYCITAIKESSTSWLDAKSFPHVPFKLEKDTQNAPSAYELDFLVDEMRYRYGFSVSAYGVMGEYLEYLPNSRWRSLFTRKYEGGQEIVTFAREVKKIEVSRRELILSRAAAIKRPDILGDIALALTKGIDFLLLTERDSQMRILEVAEALADGLVTFDEIAVLLKVADVGISRVDIWQSEEDLESDSLPDDIPEEIRNFFLQLLTQQADQAGKIMRRRLEFFHNSADHEAPPLYLADESDGTLAWLAVSVAVLKALRAGNVVWADELDSSLHPYLVRLIVGLFTDTSINTRGAQLIFTTHDVALLGQYEETGLSAENIWFTEKNREGVTELFSLADFPKANGANIEKRYLAGRYGAVPLTAGSIFRSLVDERPINREPEKVG